MADLYQLMHKNDICGILAIDEAGNLVNYETLDKKAALFLGNADILLMKRWWEARSVPASRTAMQEIIRKAGCETAKIYLAKNLALSLTDTYWICPASMNLTWEQVNLYRNAPDHLNGQIPYHNLSSYDPNASLGGQMDKYWDISKKPPVLIKTAYREFGQQALNEAFAAKLHKRQETHFPFVTYSVRKTKDNGIQCLCEAFTNESIELVSALEVIESEKTGQSTSLYDAYIGICAAHGLDEKYMREFMDYQTLTDFVISNTDEHLLNFGVLRDSDSLRLIGPAPLFDAGNSMFYSDSRLKPYKRHELLERTITAIHDKEEAMLKHITNRMIVKEDLLPSPEETKRFYTDNGIPEEKADFIAKSYSRKLELLRDFQKGRTISLYLEKKRMREMKA